VGKQIIAMAAPNLSRLTLELGGQCPFIVCADGDLARAVPAALR
jgi:acyl-CoA reductase-like NAD-dependent aldehyde dehydrogenase